VPMQQGRGVVFEADKENFDFYHLPLQHVLMWMDVLGFDEQSVFDALEPFREEVAQPFDTFALSLQDQLHGKAYIQPTSRPMEQVCIGLVFAEWHSIDGGVGQQSKPSAAPACTHHQTASRAQSCEAPHLLLAQPHSERGATRRKHCQDAFPPIFIFDYSPFRRPITPALIPCKVIPVRHTCCCSRF
jgi:hypothetical protein